MQLVIDISDEEYKKISNSNPSYADDFPIYYAIKNAIILPKGHGELKDVSPIVDDIASVRTYSFQQAIDLDVFKRKLLSAETLVEADVKKPKQATMLLKFTKDFAGNWKAGNVVKAEYVSNDKMLVDGTATVNAKQLLKHCEIISEEELHDDKIGSEE